MAKRYRSNILITLAILEAIHNSGWANVRQIIRQASVPHTRLKSKINEMMTLGIVSESKIDESYKAYILTEKGVQALKKMRELVYLLNSTGLIDQSQLSVSN
ncbi:MAG: winged helix-turn-helix domain-containing protein [Candidatus Geothermarchaeales archaeon]